MASPPAPAAAPVPSASPQDRSRADAQAERLIKHYAPEEKPVHEQVKQGCLIYLGIAFGVVGLGILALYLYHLAK